MPLSPAAQRSVFLVLPPKLRQVPRLVLLNRGRSPVPESLNP